MKPILFLVAALLAATTGAAGESARIALVVDDIAWSLDRGDERRLRFVADEVNVSLDHDAMREIRWSESGAFTLAREPGTLACRGEASRSEGNCRFTGSLAYEDALAVRGIALEHRRDLLALALVDANIALVDDLAREGFPIRKDDDLMAVAALEVTGAYVRTLKAAGLRVAGLDDLVACRALAVDAAFLGQMAAAGYPALDAREAIRLRAVGVTPDYAETMNRVLGAVRAVDAVGGMQ